MAGADYADDLALLANTPYQPEFLLHILEQAAKVISLYLNADKIECMCFKQKGTIIPLNSKP